MRACLVVFDIVLYRPVVVHVLKADKLAVRQGHDTFFNPKATTSVENVLAAFRLGNVGEKLTQILYMLKKFAFPKKKKSNIR